MMDDGGSWFGIICQGDKAAFRCCSLFQDKFITPQLVCKDFNPTVSLLLYWHNPACTAPAVFVNINRVPIKGKSRMLCSSAVAWKLKPEHRRVDFFHASFQEAYQLCMDNLKEYWLRYWFGSSPQLHRAFKASFKTFLWLSHLRLCCFGSLSLLSSSHFFFWGSCL